VSSRQRERGGRKQRPFSHRRRRRRGGGGGCTVLITFWIDLPNGIWRGGRYASDKHIFYYYYYYGSIGYRA